MRLVTVDDVGHGQPSGPVVIAPPEVEPAPVPLDGTTVMTMVLDARVGTWLDPGAVAPHPVVRRRDQDRPRLGGVEVLSLDALVRDPATVARLSPEVAEELAIQVAGLQERLRLRALALRSTEAPGPAEPEHYLTAEEAGAILNVTPKWLYKHKKRLPFARSLSRKVLRFSEAGLRRWQQAQNRR